MLSIITRIVYVLQAIYSHVVIFEKLLNDFDKKNEVICFE